MWTAKEIMEKRFSSFEFPFQTHIKDIFRYLSLFHSKTKIEVSTSIFKFVVSFFSLGMGLIGGLGEAVQPCYNQFLRGRGVVFADMGGSYSLSYFREKTDYILYL